MVKQLSISMVNQFAPFVPGSAVCGTLIVDIEQPTSYKQIAVHLKGEGKVGWTVDNDDDKCETYTSSETYVHLKSVVWTSSDGVLPAGSHEFIFEFVLPTSCPSSHKSILGDITYVIKGVISTGQFKFDHKVRQIIDVLELVSIDETVTQMPVCIKKQKTVGFLCWKSGDITFSVHIPRTGFYVGEQIPVKVHIENGSGRRIVARCELVDSTEYYASGSRQVIKNQALQYRTEPVQPHMTSGEISLSFVIPQNRPLISHSNIIQIVFSVKVTLEIFGAFNPVISIPLSIGNYHAVN